MRTIPGKCLYERRKPSYLNLILNIVIALFLIILAAEVIFNTYYISIYVKGRSMMPTLTGAESYGNTDNVVAGGDYVFINKQAAPDYFDIVVVETESGGRHYDIIKRVIAFGGDTVKLDHGRLFIKYKGQSEFTPIEEKYLGEEFCTPEKPINTFPSDSLEGHVVAENCMFLLGDNRDNSEDSRGSKGDFPLSALVGVVPQWSLDVKGFVTAVYTFFDFTLGFSKFKNNGYGD